MVQNRIMKKQGQNINNFTIYHPDSFFGSMRGTISAFSSCRVSYMNIILLQHLQSVAKTKKDYRGHMTPTRLTYGKNVSANLIYFAELFVKISI